MAAKAKRNTKRRARPKAKSKKDGVITVAAGMDFKPWQPDPNSEKPFPPQHEIDVIAAMCGFAYNAMFLTKDQLADRLDQMDENLSRKFVEGLFDAAEKLDTLAQMVKGAHVRALVSACHSVERKAA